MALLKLPILLFASIFGAPYWLILRAWFGAKMFVWLVCSSGILMLSLQLFDTRPDFATQKLAYFFYEYVEFFQLIAPALLGAHLVLFLFYVVSSVVLNKPRPHSWFMGNGLLGAKTPVAFVTLPFFGAMGMLAVHYSIVYQFNHWSISILHSLTVLAVGFPSVALLLWFETQNKGVFPIGHATTRNKSRISSQTTHTKETLEKIFSRRDPALKGIAEGK